MREIKLMVYSLTKKKQLKQVPLPTEIEMEKFDNISIDACSPFNLMRQGRQCIIDSEIFCKMANHVQVSNGQHCFIIDLNDDEPRLVGEIDAMEQFFDPEQYIETGIKLTIVEEGDHQVHKRSLSTTEFGNLVFEYKDDDLCGIYRQFALIDWLEYKFMKKAAQQQIKPKKIDLKSLWASFGNDTLFTYLTKDLLILKTIYNFLVQKEFKPQETDKGEFRSHPDLRRLNFVLTQNRFFYKTETSLECRSSIADELGNQITRDAFLQIGSLSPEFSLYRFFNNQESFRTVIDNISPEAIEAIDTCFVENNSTRKFRLMVWPSKLILLTFMNESTVLRDEEIQKEINKATKKLRGLCHRDEITVKRPVTMRYVDMEWFFADRKNFVAFESMLLGLPNSVYTSEFMNCLLDQFWKETQRKIILWQFLPYVAYIVTSICYMYDTLKPREEEKQDWDYYQNKSLGILTLIFWVFNLRIEIYQLLAARKSNKKNCFNYLMSVWNWLDIGGLLLMLFITLNTLLELQWLSNEALCEIAAWSSCFIFVSMFNWFRLFERTSFYVQLVIELLYEIRWFGALVFISLLMFGLPIVMLNLNRQGESVIIKPIYEQWFVDIIMNQALAAMGEPHYATFENNDNAGTVYWFFFLATFFTKTTMISMLINVMSDIYARVVEKKDVNSTRTKLNILSEQSSILAAQSEKQTRKVFMIIVQPNDLGYQGENWQGQINEIARINQKQVDVLGRKLAKKTDDLQRTLNEFTERDQDQDRYLKQLVQSEVKSVKKEVGNMQKEVGNMQKEVGNMQKEVGNMRSDVNMVQNSVNELSKSIKNEIAELKEMLLSKVI